MIKVKDWETLFEALKRVEEGSTETLQFDNGRVLRLFKGPPSHKSKIYLVEERGDKLTLNVKIVIEEVGSRTLRALSNGSKLCFIYTGVGGVYIGYTTVNI